MLGIFIGVASVIWLLAIGEGISKKAQEQIESLGADNIIVRSVKPPNESLPDSRGPIPYGLKREDYERLMTIKTIDRALKIRELRRQFRHNDRLVDGRLVGCTPEYAQVTHLEVDRGHFISDAEMEQKEKTLRPVGRSRRAAVPLRKSDRREHSHRRGLLRRRGGDEAARIDRRHRRLAGGAGFHRRRLHSHHHAVDAHRRYRGHARAAARSRARSSSCRK